MHPATPLLLVAVFLALASPAAQADPPRTSALQCAGGGLAAPPEFTQVSRGRTEYRFSGACIGREGHSFAYRVDATWTPTENGRGNASATEILHIDMTSGPARSYSILLGASCGADPWLYPGTTCQRIGDNVPAEVREWWWDVTSAPFPFSRRGIPHGQHASLRAQYDRANGVFDSRSLYSERTSIETVEKVGTQAAGMEMTEQAVAAAARPTGGEAGIIIVSGNTPYVRTQSASTPAIEAGPLHRAGTPTSEAIQTIGAASKLSICATARQARARNSPSAPGLEARCTEAGGQP